ncbi:MAG TPA: pyridoxamine 5'-phosphate oxidase family protein [Solirubrobacteraceae bacterium]|nr:pyridoxamine 5'-phosphate oxidase family protein [Solirubrobacteraceae bacterium]
MADKLEGRAKEILEEPHYAVVSIPRDDGSVQAIVAWVHPDGDNLAVNSAEGRAWPANLRRAGKATITSMATPYEWVSVAGTLEDDTHEGAEQHINELAHKYIGTDYPYLQPGEQRIKFTLRPDRVTYVNQG